MPYLTYLELTVSTAAPNAVKEVKPIIQQKSPLHLELDQSDAGLLLFREHCRQSFLGKFLQDKGVQCIWCR